MGALGYSAGYSAGFTGGLLWWILGGIHWRAALAEMASSSAGILGGIHWPAALAGYLALAGYSAGSTGEPLWRDTRREAGSTGEQLWRDTGRDWQAALAGYWAGSTGQLLWLDTWLWPDTRRDPLASRSGGILGGRRDPLASSCGEILGGTGKQLWRDTERDPLASCSGGILGSGRILGGIHWQASLAGYWAGRILGGIHWRASLAGYWVGAWCRSIANADSNVKSNNPFLSGGEQQLLQMLRHPDKNILGQGPGKTSGSPRCFHLASPPWRRATALTFASKTLGKSLPVSRFPIP